MDSEWADKLKRTEAALERKESFGEGISLLTELRSDVFGQITSIVNTFPDEAFSAVPFPEGEGRCGRTLAECMWRVFRSEDMAANTLIGRKEQVFFRDGWLQKTIGASAAEDEEPGAEEAVRFSERIDVKALFEYGKAVREETERMLKDLRYEDLAVKLTEEDGKRLEESGSSDPAGEGFLPEGRLPGTSVGALIGEAFGSRWVTETEEMRRIKNSLVKTARKGVDTIAYCGLSCDHCFLMEWCGSCRTRYNTCSYATMFPDRVCPNASCCREKGYDGCWECGELGSCGKGFYAGGNDTNAVRAMAFFIGRHGKDGLRKALTKLHERHDFQKVQEILGSDTEKGLMILEAALEKDMPEGK